MNDQHQNNFTSLSFDIVDYFIGFIIFIIYNIIELFLINGLVCGKLQMLRKHEVSDYNKGIYDL